MQKDMISFETDFSSYGILDASVPADNALEAMLSDENIQVIHAYTPLNFKKRHQIKRSNLTFDFHCNTVTAKGIEHAKPNDPFSALFHITGERLNEIRSVSLSHPLQELYDIFEVDDSDGFELDSWWIVTCNALNGREEKEIDKMLQVTEIIDKTHVRFNYKMGWTLETGRTLTYHKVEPIVDVSVSNMRFIGNQEGEETGVEPLAYEYAVNCNVSNIQAKYTYWPVILRRHNTGYVTEQCSLHNPIEVVVGGTGYLTQQIHCLYGKVRDCEASNARHLNDFTGSAYCMVENCHCDGDFHGAFVTHGQFEHDLTYLGNSGLLSFANSGPTWGSSAKRVTVIRHIGCWGLAFSKVSDLTLQDVVIQKTEKYEEGGTMLLNADGLQVRGCQADRLVLTQRSNRSKRPVVIENSYFSEGVEIIKTGEAAVKNKIRIVNTLDKEGKEC